MTDHETPVDEAPAAPDVPNAKPGSRGWRIVVAVLLALSIGLAFLAAIQTSRVNGESDREAAVRRAAAAMGTALVTYDYTNLDMAKSDVLRLATGTFRRQYNEAFTGGLDELLTSTKATSKVREAEVFLGELSDDAATAIVVLDTVVSGTSGTNRTLVSYLRLDLIRTGGRWLTNAVTSLNLGQTAGGNDLPTAPTTTTTP